MNKFFKCIIGTLLTVAVLSGCSSVGKMSREPNATSGQDGQTGGTGSRGQDGEAGQATLITDCDGLIATAVYKTEYMRSWQEDLRDMCSIRGATPIGLTKANASLDAKIERLFASGYLRNVKMPSSFGEDSSTALERITSKMIFINELVNKVQAQESTDFGCHRGRMTNRHNEERIYRVCIRANLNRLSRQGDVVVDLTYKAFEIGVDGKTDTSAFINERTRLSVIPPICKNGMPMFKNSSIESNGTKYTQTTTSGCEEYSVDYQGIYPSIKIRFEVN